MDLCKKKKNLFFRYFYNISKKGDLYTLNLSFMSCVCYLCEEGMYADCLLQ